MKYTPEITKQLLVDWNNGDGYSVAELAEKFDVPPRSIITKLGNLGVYKSRRYRNKQGKIPVKKAEYIDKIATILKVDADRLDSLEKCNKWILELLVDRLPKEDLQDE